MDAAGDASVAMGMNDGVLEGAAARDFSFAPASIDAKPPALSAPGGAGGGGATMHTNQRTIRSLRQKEFGHKTAEQANIRGGGGAGKD